MMSKIYFSIKSFSELENKELYELLKLRTDVFVVEQDCPYPELDRKDYKAQHLMMWSEKEIIGYVRILPQGVSYPKDSSIGRVVIKKTYRGLKQGRPLMLQGMKYIKEIWKENSIRISAQKHLSKFYESLGFRQVSEEYLEDDIPHVEMLFS